MKQRWQAWRLRRQVNRAHAQALRFYCLTDGKPHDWDWDYAMERRRHEDEIAKFGHGLNHPYPAWVTAIGDYLACQRGCGARRLINEPSR